MHCSRTACYRPASKFVAHLKQMKTFSSACKQSTSHPRTCTASVSTKSKCSVSQRSSQIISQRNSQRIFQYTSSIHNAPAALSSVKPLLNFSTRSFCVSTDKSSEIHAVSNASQNESNDYLDVEELSETDSQYRAMLSEASDDDQLLSELLKDEEIVRYVERQMDMDRFMSRENRRNNMRLTSMNTKGPTIGEEEQVDKPTITSQTTDEVASTEEVDLSEADDYILTEEADVKEIILLETGIDDGLVAVLTKERILSILEENYAIDVCCLDVDNDRFTFDYVDFFIIVSGRSTRHLKQMASNIRFQFKQASKEMGLKQRIPVEGIDSTDWMAVDTGNCVIHLMLPETRIMYDLESLWTNGPEGDPQYQQMLLDEKTLSAPIPLDLLYPEDEPTDRTVEESVKQTPKIFSMGLPPSMQRSRITSKIPKTVE